MPLYQTLGLLVFAYVVRFMPQALGSCRASLLQINPHTEQALRRTPCSTTLRIRPPQTMQ